MRQLKIGGLYQHFKGTKVKVLFEALDSETQKPMVVYTHLDDGQIWVRDREMFLETIERDGHKIERFSEVK